MSPAPVVLVGLAVSPEADADLGGLRGWIRDFGYEPVLPAGAAEAIRWVGERPLAAAFVEADWRSETVGCVWEQIQGALGRRLVLMARERGPDLWSQAVRVGVGAVLPLPAVRESVGAALKAVTVGSTGGTYS